MIDWQRQWDSFVLEFITKRGYINIFKGLGVTMQIALVGLILGIIIGTLIATVRVLPKYKLIVRILDKICTVYVAFFRGTPMIVQLLVGYWVLFPLLGISVEATMVASIIFGLNSGAYVSEILPSELGLPVSLARQQVEKGFIISPFAFSFGRLCSTNQCLQKFVA